MVLESRFFATAIVNISRSYKLRRFDIMQQCDRQTDAFMIAKDALSITCCRAKKNIV